jgi:hypothetical protein
MAVHRFSFFSCVCLALTGAAAQGYLPNDPESEIRRLRKYLSTARKEAIVHQEAFIKRLADFKQVLLRSKQRLEKGSARDKENGAILDSTLGYLSESNLETKAAHLLEILKTANLNQMTEGKDAFDRSRALAHATQNLQAMLMGDARAAKLRAKRMEIAGLIKRTDECTRLPKAVRAKTELGKAGKDPLGIPILEQKPAKEILALIDQLTRIHGLQKTVTERLDELRRPLIRLGPEMEKQK